VEEILMLKRKMVILPILVVVLMLVVAPVFAAEPAEPHDANSFWIEPSVTTITGSYVYIGGYTVGDKFNVTIWTNCSVNCGGWQTWLLYPPTYINGTRAGYTAGGKSDFFANISTIPVDASFKVHNASHNRVDFGESWAGSGSFRNPGYGSLCWIEFEVIADDGIFAPLTFYGYTSALWRTYLINGDTLQKVDPITVYGATVVPEFNPLMLLTVLTAISVPTAIAIRRKRL
jgi:hypothetical protein